MPETGFEKLYSLCFDENERIRIRSEIARAGQPVYLITGDSLL